MRPKRKPKSKVTQGRHLNPNDVKAISFVCTLILATITVILGIRDPVVWAFLGTALGVSFGQPVAGSSR